MEVVEGSGCGVRPGGGAGCSLEPRVSEEEKAKASAPPSRVRAKLAELFGVDLRGLALLRIGVGLLLLADLAGRAGDLVAHYTDLGVLPRAELIARSPNNWRISLHLLSGRPEVQAVLFGLAALAALSLTVGFRTRRAAVASFVLLASLQTRNPLVNNAGDKLLLLIVLLGILVPWGARFSLDAVRHRLAGGGALPGRVLSVGTVALVLQMPLVYFFTGILKNGERWRGDFTAVFFALNTGELVTPFGRVLAEFPLPLLKALTAGTLVLEIAAPLLLFSPLFTTPVRCVVLASLVGLQAGFGLSLSVILFPFVSTLAIIPLVPSAVWDRLGAMVRTRRPAQLHFDAACEFCRRSAHLFAALLRLPPPLPASVDRSIQADLEANGSWVVVDADGRRHFAYAGFVALLRASTFGRLVVPLFAHRWVARVGEWSYRAVATRRMAAAPTMRWLSPAPVAVRNTRLVGAVSVFVLGYGLAANVASLDVFKLPDSIRWAGTAFHLRQDWSMFAPNPPRTSRWYVVVGERLDGTRVDIGRGGAPVDFARPDDLEAQFANGRWRKLYGNMSESDTRRHRNAFAKHFCRQWNGQHTGDAQVRRVKIYGLSQRTVLEGERPKPKRKLLHAQGCRHDRPREETPPQTPVAGQRAAR